MLALAAQCCVLGQTQQSTVSGRVVSEGHPVPDCAVRVQGSTIAVQTDSAGRFRLPVERARVYLSAGKPGFYNNRMLVKSGASVVIDLTPIPPNDNTAYSWQDPRPNKAQKDNCGNCHDRIFSEWSHDGHAESAVSPLLLTMYTGQDVSGRPNSGPGYKVDWTDEGNCATCHAPLATISKGGDIELTALKGVPLNGVTCDFCHKVGSISNVPSAPDFTDIHMLRPASGKKLLFGPFDDATFPKEIPDFSYSTLFRQSSFCAPCHNGRFWGVPVYDTYTEWQNSPYPAADVQCQTCHMGSTKREHFIANEKDGGKERNPLSIGSHSMMGEDVGSFISNAVRMTTRSQIQEDVLRIDVAIQNTGAGHDIPTGQPIRNLILLVSAKDPGGRGLEFLQGERVPVWGGMGPSPEDYGGLPGKGFAKVLQTLNEYQKFSFVSDLKRVEGDFPAPFWRRNRILSDNRIPPKGTDQSVYLYDIPLNMSKADVSVRLIYRKAFRPLAEVKGWKLTDTVIAVNEMTVDRKSPNL